MRKRRIIGVIAVATAIFLTGTVVFAEEGRSMGSFGERRGDDYRATMMSSSTNTRMQSVRDEVKVRSEGQRVKVEQRLLDIQDKMKQQMAERLTKQFDGLNETWTDHFMNVLDRYQTLLEKIKARADVAAGKGKDVTATNAAIQSATTAVETARVAVIAQAAKTYMVATSTLPTTATSTSRGQSDLINGFRTAFKNIHTTLFKDLFALRDGVMKDARRAVQNAVQTLGKVPGTNNSSSASTTDSN